MIKLMIVGRRRPGTTLAQHRQHIRHVHGELVLRYIAESPELAPQRYVQNAVFDGCYSAGTLATEPLASQCDFVTQIWATDMAAVGRSRAQPFYLEHLRPDEPRFVDEATVAFMPVHEQLVRQSPDAAQASVKLFGLTCRPTGATGASGDATAAWNAALAALAATPAGSGVARHVRNAVLSPPGQTPPADQIDEFWLHDAAAAQALAAAWQASVVQPLAASGHIAADGAATWLAHEQVLHAGSGWLHRA